MPDLTEDGVFDLGGDADFDFDAALAAKVGRDAEPGDEPDEGSTDDESAPEGGQPRTSTGQFAARETPDVYDDEDPDEEPDGAGDDPEDQLLYGKFKSKDDVVEAYGGLEQELGRLRQEIGDLRQQRQPEPAQQAGVPLTPQTYELVDQAVIENPEATARWALENDPSGVLYERVMDAWYETPGQARAAARFERDLDQAALLGAVGTAIEPAVNREQMLVQAQTFESAWKEVAKSHPDMEQLRPAMAKAAEEAPELASALTTGDPAKVKRMVETLYKIAKGGSADTLIAQATQLNDEQRQAETQSKKKAGLTRGSQPHRPSGRTNDGVKAFKDDLLSDTGTDIVRGLTIG